MEEELRIVVKVELAMKMKTREYCKWRLSVCLSVEKIKETV